MPFGPRRKKAPSSPNRISPLRLSSSLRASRRPTRQLSQVLRPYRCAFCAVLPASADDRRFPKTSSVKPALPTRAAFAINPPHGRIGYPLRPRGRIQTLQSVLRCLASEKLNATFSLYSWRSSLIFQRPCNRRARAKTAAISRMRTSPSPTIGVDGFRSL